MCSKGGVCIVSFTVQRIIQDVQGMFASFHAKRRNVMHEEFPSVGSFARKYFFDSFRLVHPAVDLTCKAPRRAAVADARLVAQLRTETAEVWASPTLGFFHIPFTDRQ